MRCQVPAARQPHGSDHHVRVRTGRAHRRVMQADQGYSLRFGDARGAVLAQRPGDDEVGAVADPQRVGSSNSRSRGTSREPVNPPPGTVCPADQQPFPNDYLGSLRVNSSNWVPPKWNRRTRPHKLPPWLPATTCLDEAIRLHHAAGLVTTRRRGSRSRLGRDCRTRDTGDRANGAYLRPVMTLSHRAQLWCRSLISIRRTEARTMIDSPTMTVANPAATGPWLMTRPMRSTVIPRNNSAVAIITGRCESRSGTAVAANFGAS